MQEKVMNLLIKKKMDAFCNSLPDELEKQVRQNLFVAGGAIASMCHGYEPNDYDVYIADQDVLLKLAEHLVERFRENEKKSKKDPKNRMPEIKVFKDEKTNRVRVKIQSSGVASTTENANDQYFETADPLIGAEWVQTAVLKGTQKKTKQVDYEPTFITENAISLGNADIQIITRFSGPPEETVEAFDFDHVKNYWWMASGRIVWKISAQTALLTRTLRYKGSLYPLCALIRTRKFLLRGFKCPVDVYVRLAFELNQLDLTDPHVLADQLIGVDFAYFAQLIEYIQADVKKDPTMTVDNTYICQVLDEIDSRDLSKSFQQLDLMQQEVMTEQEGNQL